jgi:prepilin-type N-terminal cleavage/methylation domain-containing protein
MRTMNRAASRGFTLVEMLIVTVIGSLVLFSTFNVLISNQRTFMAAASKIDGQRTLRSGMAIIYGELREISTQTGDLITMTADTVEIRATRAFGLVCRVDISGASPQLTVKSIGDPFVVSDSLFVLAANNPATITDDVWKLAVVRSIDSTTTCNGSDTAQAMTITGTTVGAPPDAILSGAPARAFVRYIYGLFTVDGETFLAREGEVSGVSGTRVIQPLVGPLWNLDGAPTFTYWTDLGTVALVPAQVDNIRITLRTRTPIPGDVLSDSLVSDVHPRN